MVKSNWVEVSLTAGAEQVEAVAEVFSRFMPNGVVIEQIVQLGSHEEALLAESELRVFGYLLNNGEVESKRRKLEEALWHLSQIQPLKAAKYKSIQDEDWMAAWKQHYKPIKIGKRLMIVPAWISSDFLGRIPIRINPGMAFGTGTHPSTQLCLQLLEKIITPGYTVIDIGCGSGILSIAALKLGSSHVLAVDNDPAAVQSTHENAKENGIGKMLEIGLGSVSEILAGQFSLICVNMVVVNILAAVIMELFNHGLADLVKKDGYIILAGLLDTQAPEVIASAQKRGLTLLKTVSILDWTALLLEKKSVGGFALKGTGASTGCRLKLVPRL